jgi:hypothetical protein
MVDVQAAMEEVLAAERAAVDAIAASRRRADQLVQDARARARRIAERARARVAALERVNTTRALDVDEPAEVNQLSAGGGLSEQERARLDAALQLLADRLLESGDAGA